MTARAISEELHEAFGGIDIYLFDQLLRGRFDRRPRVLDAGCGHGRNLPYLLTHGFEVFATDADEAAVTATRRLFADLAPHLPVGNVHRGAVESLPFGDGSVDAVISSAVLHFARDDEHFRAMAGEMWRVLAPGGLFFARLASSIGIERRLAAPTGRQQLPDGSERFVMDEATLIALTQSLGGRLLDPLKTTIVQGLRAMTTWVVEKGR